MPQNQNTIIPENRKHNNTRKLKQYDCTINKLHKIKMINSIKLKRNNSTNSKQTESNKNNTEQ